ncbi:MAG: TAXI family TRAP transporter solute-binding subunit [Betaproteobacteria bacterium]|nr:TAXI family TRAP transporter solute-binding subunit [Betaproteobacteria bacterium]
MPARTNRLLHAALFVSALVPISASAQVPRSASLATHAVASLYHAIGTGIATVLSRHSPITVRVQPFAGPPAWLPSMDQGDTDMGVLTSADAVTSYQGMNPYKRPFKNTRILLVGGAIQLSFYVRKDSPVQTIADLKGKRVPTDFPGIPIVKLSSTAGLASSGLSYSDIVKVPVSDLQAANQAFMEGRTDANWLGLRSPLVEEGNARLGGVRWISVNDTPQGAERMNAIYPGSYPSTVKAGTATGLVKDTAMLTNDIYLVGTKDLSEEAAYAIVKALWENTKDLWAAYAALSSWRQERMVSAQAFIPYHPGAIRFYREKGAWNKAMDDLQARLLAQ